MMEFDADKSISVMKFDVAKTISMMEFIIWGLLLLGVCIYFVINTVKYIYI